MSPQIKRRVLMSNWHPAVKTLDDTSSNRTILCRALICVVHLTVLQPDTNVVVITGVADSSNVNLHRGRRYIVINVYSPFLGIIST